MKNELEYIRNHCIGNRLTIAVAESVTAGCLQLQLSNIPDAKDFFQGGITAYNCGQKARHLDIEPIFANTCNAVDQDIAVEMAYAACSLFCSAIGLSATGYAAPEGAVKAPYAFFAIVYKDKLLSADRIVAETNDYGQGVQQEYAGKILRLLAEQLKGGILVWD